MKIDKSLFTADELATYQALIAKARVDEDTEQGAGVEKSAENPALTAALDRLEALEKSMDMAVYCEVAKKYAPLGEDEGELANTLYELHKSSEESYNAYIKIMDKSLDLIEKSGVFAELGKSARGDVSGGVVGRVEAAAAEIMKSDSSMTKEQAIAKAWEANPDLVAEYDREYFGG